MKIFLILLFAVSVVKGAPHYALTNQGVVFDSINPSYYPCAVDMRNSSFPYDWAIYASTDHKFPGGIYLYVADGDPSVKSNWITYDSAKNAGGFDSYVTKPPTNPIFRDEVEGSSTETPCVNWVRDTCFMSYQVGFFDPGANVYSTGLTQGTLLCYSLDGVNFTRYTAHTSGVSAVILPEPSQTPAADHTGYFIWGVNPFDSVPYTYIGNSLVVGGEFAAAGQWGSNNAINWVFLNTTEPIWGRDTASGIYGRVYGLIDSQGVSNNGIRPQNARKLANGNVVTVSFGKQRSYGGSEEVANLYEVTWEPDGLTIPRYCEKMMERSGENYDRNEHATPTTLIYNNKLVVFYTATDSITNRLAMATCAMSDTNKISSAPMIPYGIDKITKQKSNFVSNPALSSLPSWLTFVTSGTGSYTFETRGINLLSKGNFPGFRVTNAIVPANYDFIEYYVNCYFPKGRGQIGVSIKTGTTYQAAGAQVDGVGAITYSGVSYLWSPYTRVNSVTTYLDTTDFRHIQGYSNFGVRWWPRQRKAQLLGLGHSPGQMWEVDSTMNLNQNFYPTFWRNATTDTMIIYDITLKTKLRDTVPPTVTSVNSENKTLTVSFNEPIDYDTNGVTGFKVMSPDSISLTYQSGIGTDTLRYSMASKGRDSVLLSYTETGIIDYGNNSLASFSNLKGNVISSITITTQPQPCTSSVTGRFYTAYIGDSISRQWFKNGVATSTDSVYTFTATQSNDLDSVRLRLVSGTDTAYSEWAKFHWYPESTLIYVHGNFLDGSGWTATLSDSVLTTESGSATAQVFGYNHKVLLTKKKYRLNITNGTYSVQLYIGSDNKSKLFFFFGGK